MSEKEKTLLPAHLATADVIPLIIPLTVSSGGQVLSALTGAPVAVGKRGMLEDFEGLLPTNACMLTAEIGTLVLVPRSKILDAEDHTKSGTSKLAEGSFQIKASEGTIIATARPLAELFADLLMQGYTDTITIPKAEKVITMGDSPVYSVPAAIRTDNGGPHSIRIECAAVGKALVDLEALAEGAGAAIGGVPAQVKGAGHIKVGAQCSLTVIPTDNERAQVDLQESAQVEGSALVVSSKDKGVVRGTDVSCFGADGVSVTATEQCRVIHGRDGVVDADVPGAVVSGLSGTHTLGAGAVSTLVSGEQVAGSESVQVIEQGTQKGGQHAVQIGKRGVVVQEASHYAVQDAGDQARQTAGHFAVMRAGNQAVQRAGDDCHLVAMEFAKQTAGNRATLMAGQGSTQTAGDDCICTQRGPGGTVTLGSRSVFSLRGDDGQLLYTLTAGADFEAGVAMAVTPSGLVPAHEAGESPVLVEGQI